MENMADSATAMVTMEVAMDYGGGYGGSYRNSYGGWSNGIIVILILIRRTHSTSHAFICSLKIASLLLFDYLIKLAF